MDYIIKTDEEVYFGGWDPVLGNQIFTSDVKLAYRMRSALAVKTLEKLSAEHPQAKITKYEETKVA